MANAGTAYYRITHSLGVVTILAYSEYDAIEKFKKQYPNCTIKKKEKQ